MTQLTAVITGASYGIGYAIATKLFAAGYNIAITARTQSKLSDAKTQLQAFNLDGKILALAADMSKTEDRKEFASQILDLLGTPNVLVNNAGTFIPGQIQDEAEGSFELMMETNVYSAYHLTRLLLPKMIDKRSGHIFNISSVAGIMAYSNGGSYSISKYAMNGFSKVLRSELIPHNIKVTTVMPGATLTNSWAGTDLPDDRFMTANDVADMVYASLCLSSSACVEEIILRPILGDI
ncbi:MAG: SDR family oxidoreductase [Bacteroidota bacterium]|nr:SDR family oxidoreductase [Bacteroidota bacterium]